MKDISIAISLREIIYRNCIFSDIVESMIDNEESRIKKVVEEESGNYIYISVFDPDMSKSEIEGLILDSISNKVDDLDLDKVLHELNINKEDAKKTIKDTLPIVFFSMERSLKCKNDNQTIYYIEPSVSKI